MIALTYNENLVESPINLSDKELSKTWNVIAKEPFENVVTACCYTGKSKNSSTVYAAIWVNYKRSTGKAGGGGYHKTSAAIEDAIRNMGYELSNSLSGDSSIEDALIALAKLQYPDTEFLVVTN